MAKIKGTNIIFLNEKEQVLLQLRDDNPAIPYPNMWALPGGHIDAGESPFECIVREAKEELGIELHEAALFVAAERAYGTEYTYWAKASFRLDQIRLSEGQKVQWFTYEQIQAMHLIYEDNAILDDFFRERPFDVVR
uniref:8-oxo-dGTP diphosphatase n=1 Tax=Thermosporothrix sp. COM3 TaxID=2490863 RepID=A0A455SIW4_9CHLR|nr:hypothetical protein KTC_20120 [Thermosporothrix sp. COM3]